MMVCNVDHWLFQIGPMEKANPNQWVRRAQLFCAKKRLISIVFKTLLWSSTLFLFFFLKARLMVALALSFKRLSGWADSVNFTQKRFGIAQRSHRAVPLLPPSGRRACCCCCCRLWSWAFARSAERLLAMRSVVLFMLRAASMARSRVRLISSS